MATGAIEINGNNPYDIKVFPNPAKEQINISYMLEKLIPVNYFITSSNGQILQQGQIAQQGVGENIQSISLTTLNAKQPIFVTFVFDHKYFVTKKVFKE